MRIVASLTVLLIVLVLCALPSYGQEDLKVSISTSHVNANPGDEITYVIKYSNGGITPASNLIIKDYLSSSGLYTYVSSSPSGTVSGNVITWDQTQIQELALLSNGEFQILVTVKAGIPGNGVTQASNGYYISASPGILENHATITSSYTTIPVQSNVVSTQIEQNYGIHVNNASGVIKSSANTMIYYLIQVTNNGNIYDRYDLSSINFDCDGPGGLGFDAIQASFADQSDNPITKTDWIAPDQTYYFLLKLKTDGGANPGHWSCHRVIATSMVGGITGEGNIKTKVEGSPRYPLISLSKIDAKDPVEAGEIFNYKIYAFNSNDAYPANNLVVKETYPPNITFVSSTPAPDPGFNNQWSLGTLDYGLSAAKTINITVKVNALNNCSGSMTNTVSVSYDGSDSANPPSASVVTAIKSYPDLLITKNAQTPSTPAQKGETITYTINYQNAGTCDAPNSQIKEEFDDEHTNIISSGGGTQSGNTITWNLGLLTPGQSGTITYTALIDPESTFNPGTTQIDSKATISTIATETNINNNTATASVSVSVLPDMKVEILPDNEISDAGTEYTYRVKVSNVGDIAASNVEIKNLLPAGLSMGTISHAGNNIGGMISWPIIPTFNVNDYVQYQVKVTPSCSFVPSFTVAATVTSAIIDKNEANNSITLNPVVRDMIPPVLANVPSDITIGCEDIPAVGSPTATDNCDNDPNVYYLGETSTRGTNPLLPDYYNYKLTRSWEAIDGSGNHSNKGIQVITIEDNTPPETPVLVDVTVGECSGTPVAPTTTDVCKGTISGSTTTVFPLTAQGPTVVTWTFDDGNGNVITANQNIIVKDITAPVPDVADLPVIKGECSATVTTPTATDNCKDKIVGTTTDPLTYSEQGNYTIHWTYDDGNGNNFTQTQSVVVDDTNPPIPDLAFLPVITGECSATATAPTATDNCKDKIVGTTTDPLTYSEQGNYTIRWTYDDGMGNISTQVQNVVVDDTTPPETPVLANVTVGECYGTPTFPTTTDLCKGIISGSTKTKFPITTQGTTVVTWTFDDLNGNITTANQNIIVKDITAPVPDITELPTILAECSATATAPTATDNCKDKIIGTTTDPLTYSEQGNYTIHWTYDDGQGNISTQAQSVVVHDITPPQTPVLADVTVGECSGTPVAPTTTDLCKGIITGSTKTKFPITTQGTTVVTWTFDDGNGNAITANQNVIVKDIKAPVPDIAELPEITGACSATATAPTATDNCKDKIIGTTTDPLTYSEQGNFTIHWTYDDGQGNISTQAQRVVVHDITPPQTPVLADVTVGECSGTPVAPTTMDACKGVIIGSTTTVFPLTTQGSTVVTWTFDDGNGNAITANQNVIVKDTKAPVPDIAELPEITGECSATATAPTATDNCKDKIIGVTTDPLTYSEQGNFTIHWNYDDGQGNISTQTQSVVVHDTKAPVPDVAELPAITGECSATATAPTATDNCKDKIIGTTTDPLTYSEQGNFTIHWNYDDGQGNISTQTQSVVVHDTKAPVPDIAELPAITGECSATATAPTATDNCKDKIVGTTTDPLTYSEQGNYTIYWNYDDGQGNISTQAQSVVVHDITPPQTPVLADVTVGECFGTPVAPTTTDACKGIITGNTTTVFPITTQGITVVTWTFDDGNGNTTTANQNVIVKDIKAPISDIAELPAITGECSATATTPTATDNCKDKIVGTTTDPLTYSEQGNYTIHWTYDDGHGNISTQTQSVVVHDTKAPVPDVAELPEITGECIATATAPTATDNCKDKIVGTTTDPLTYSEQGNYTIHWNYDDGHGNISTQTQSVVVDDTTPPEIPVLADVTVGECSGTPIVPTTMDACKGVIIGSTTTVFPITTQGATIVTWTFDDLHGNVTTANQKVIVANITAPVPDIAVLPNATGECSVTVNAPLATKNCQGKIVGTTSDPLTYSEQGNYTIYWTYDDGQGNISTQTQSVMVADITAPVPDIAELPAITGACSATATAPTATDNCKDKIIGVTTDPLTYSEQGNYTIHWAYDDGQGNISTQAQSVVVHDITPPQTPVLADVTVGECSGTPVAPTTMDQCRGIITGSTTTVFPLTTQGSTVVTWTFDDGNGNATTANQNVIVKDTKAPIPDVAELPEITGACSATATAPTATDNCKDKIIGTTTDPLTYSEQGNYTIHWNYDDGQGNISIQAQSVVVHDITPPQTPILADVTVGECSGTPVAPTTTDACKGIITGSTTTVFPLTAQGTTVVTWTFDDGNGNATTANQNVIVKDVTAPVPDLAILPTLTGQSSITITAPTATDNCNGSITGTTTDPLTYTVQGNYTIHWTYDDGHDNISTQTQSVIVDDTTPPERPVLADVTVGECSGTPVTPTTTDNSSGVITGTTLTAFPITVQGVTIVTWTFDDGKGNITTVNQNVIVKDITAPVPDIASLPAITEECSVTVTVPTATDNCKGKITATTTDPLNYSEQGSYTIHWRYDDGNGNISTQTQSVVVDDTTPPETPVLADVFLGECSGTPPIPTAMDNCAGIVRGTTSILFPKTKQGKNTILWTFDDGHGNVTTAYQNLILEDKTAPVPDIASLPAITEECSVTVNPPTATDNCKGKITATTTDPLTYSEQGSYTIHWSYDDGNGNIFTQTQSVVINDTTPPETPVLADIFLGECSGTPPTPTTMDNCAGIVKGTTSILFPKTKQGKNTILWTFDDGHGNLTTAYQNLILEDKTAPVPDLASLPAITAECSATVTAPTATDNCKGKIVGTTTDPLTYSEQGSYIIHWSYDDGNGNISTQTQNVVVDDATPPETPVLADVTVGECSGTPIVPTTTDFCKGTITGTTTTVFPISSQGTTIVTWTFDDGSGNVTTAQQNVIIKDNTPPQITGTIAPTTVEGCSAGEVTPPVNTVAALESMGLSVSDACMEDQLLTITSKDDVIDESPITVIRTYTIKDGSNNSTDYKQTILVVDTQKPTIVCPADLNITADAGNCNATGLILSLPVTEDNCSVTSVTNDAPAVFGLGKTVVTWTVVDKSGNTATCQQNVTVDAIPVAVDDKIAMDENSEIAGNVTTNDKGLCDVPIRMNIIAEPEFGSLTFSNDGSFKYIPDDNYFGKDKFTYQICDRDGDCSSAIVEITINSENDQPQAIADTEDLQVDVTWHGNVAVNDVLSGDGNNVWTLETQPSNGTILFNKDGTYTYTPQTSFIGNDSFSYELCDANGDCSKAKVTIHVDDVLLPNQILTPNSDDHNDTFIIKGIEYYPINKVTVYNRWGNVVYSKNNYQNEWDGVSKVSSKPLPVGTYYYLIDYGNNRHKTGFVYLDR